MRTRDFFPQLPVKIINGLSRNGLDDLERFANASDYDLIKIGHDFETYVELRDKAKWYEKELPERVYTLK